MNAKSVFIRLDKIGDLVSTLPVDQADFLRAGEVTWVVDEGVKSLCELAEPKRKCLSLPALKLPRSSFFQLYRFLKSERPQRLVIFYAPWWASLAAWLASVPLRVGRLSQWHSFLFFNWGLRQSRSASAKHESEYNWDLLHHAYRKPVNSPCPLLKIQAPVQRHIFEKLNVRSKDFVVVHPGMSGSAHNWPQAKYNQLLEILVATDIVVITGTKADDPWLTEIAPLWKTHPRVRWAQDKLNFTELIFVLQSAKAVIAPSTGVVHLAASTGTPVVGIYSATTAHHPRRWGARGLGVKILLPQPGSEDMNTISVQNVLEALP